MPVCKHPPRALGKHRDHNRSLSTPFEFVPGHAAMARPSAGHLLKEGGVADPGNNRPGTEIKVFLAVD